MIQHHKIPGVLFTLALIIGVGGFMFNSVFMFTLAVVLFGLFYFSLFNSMWHSLSEIIRILGGKDQDH